MINKIYVQPLERKDNRIYGNHSIYVEDIEKTLLKFLSYQKGYIAELPFKGLFYPLNIVNSDYLRISKDTLKKELELTDFDINNFYQYTYQQFKEILLSSLKNLRNRNLIYYEFVVMVVITKKNNNDKLETEVRDATYEEKKNIISIEREVLKQMNLKNMNMVYLTFQQDKFHNKVNQLLSERYDIDKCFEIIRIVFNKPDIIESLNEIEVEQHKKRLNDKIVNAVQKRAKYNYKKNQDKLKAFTESYFGEPNQIILNELFILNDSYIENQYKLIDKLIKIKRDGNNSNDNDSINNDNK